MGKDEIKIVIDKILSEMMGTYVPLDQQVRWQNAIAQARLTVVYECGREFTFPQIEQIILHSTVHQEVHIDGLREERLWSICSLLHETSAAALYNVAVGFVSEKVRHLRPDTQGQILAELPADYSKKEGKTSLLDVQGGKREWLTDFSHLSGGHILHTLTTAALVALLYDKYFREQHFQIQAVDLVSPNL